MDLNAATQNLVVTNHCRYASNLSSDKEKVQDQSCQNTREGRIIHRINFFFITWVILHVLKPLNLLSMDF